MPLPKCAINGLAITRRKEERNDDTGKGFFIIIGFNFHIAKVSLAAAMCVIQLWILIVSFTR